MVKPRLIAEKNNAMTDVTVATTSISLHANLTPSSAAVFKLWFYGILLRSKTIKPRLKNCPTQARSAGVMLQRLVCSNLIVLVKVRLVTSHHVTGSVAR